MGILKSRYLTGFFQLQVSEENMCFCLFQFLLETCAPSVTLDCQLDWPERSAEHTSGCVWAEAGHDPGAYLRPISLRFSSLYAASTLSWHSSFVLPHLSVMVSLPWSQPAITWNLWTTAENKTLSLGSSCQAFCANNKDTEKYTFFDLFLTPISITPTFCYFYHHSY